jgi:hypothetical protein
MRILRLFANRTYTGHLLPIVVVVAYVVLMTGAVSAQTIDPDLRPDLQRALAAQPAASSGKGRINGYVPAQAGVIKAARPPSSASTRNDGVSSPFTPRPSVSLNLPATSSIPPGTP